MNINDKFRLFVVVLVVVLLFSSCENKCNYEEFYNCYGKRFIYENSNRISPDSSFTVYEILKFQDDYYVHTTIIFDSVFSDTSSYDYNKKDGTIMLENYRERYGEAKLLNSRSTISVHFHCKYISYGDAIFFLDGKQHFVW